MAAGSEEQCGIFGGVMRNGTCFVDGYPVATGEQIDIPWVQDRLERFEREKRCVILQLRPQDFLAFTGETYWDEDIIRDLREKMKKGVSLDSPWLEWRWEDKGTVSMSKKLVSHEGRHRAKAAIEEGIGKMPVLFCEEG